MSYSTGYRKNPNRRTIPTFEKHIGASQTPASMSLEPYAPSIFDQGQTGSCVGHARARGVAIARMFAQHPLPFVPSPVEIYRLARCYERNDWMTPLADNGCDPVDSIDAIASFGVGPMHPLALRYSDADPATVNNLPTLGDLEAASGFKFLDDHQITDILSARIEAVRVALASGFPVCIDVAGGSSQFQNYNRGLLSGSGQPLDHYVCLVGYHTTVSGTVFHGHNSWGVDWGMSGAFDGDESLIHAAGDLIVCVERLP